MILFFSIVEVEMHRRRIEDPADPEPPPRKEDTDRRPDAPSATASALRLGTAAHNNNNLDTKQSPGGGGEIEEVTSTAVTSVNNDTKPRILESALLDCSNAGDIVRAALECSRGGAKKHRTSVKKGFASRAAVERWNPYPALSTPPKTSPSYNSAGGGGHHSHKSAFSPPLSHREPSPPMYR